MNGGLPVLSAREMLRALHKAGFVEKRVSGSHHFLVDPNDCARAARGGKCRNRTTGTLRGIIRQTRLTIEEFRSLL